MQEAVTRIATDYSEQNPSSKKEENKQIQTLKDELNNTQTRPNDILETWHKHCTYEFEIKEEQDGNTIKEEIGDSEERIV